MIRVMEETTKGTAQMMTEVWMTEVGCGLGAQGKPLRRSRLSRVGVSHFESTEEQ